MSRRPAHLLCLLALLLPADAEAGEKVALLAGVRAYDHSKLDDLRFPDRDVEEMAALLRQTGYTRVVVLGTAAGERDARLRPTGENLRREIESLLRGLTKRDTVLLAFSGHGLQLDEPPGSYFCPADANPSRAETLLSLPKLYGQLDDCGAGVKLLLVDACRNDPASKGGKGVDGDRLPRPPRNTAALFSCSPKQQSFEHEAWGHGAFFYTVLDGLRPGRDGRLPADADGDGEVDFDELSRFVRKNVPAHVSKVLRDAEQTPNAVANLAEVVTLVRGAAVRGPIVPGPAAKAPLPPRPEAIPETVESKTVGMKLRLIPAGKFLMGAADDDPDARLDEWPRHEVTVRTPFYLAAHEVTVAQFEAFVRATGYETEGEKLGGVRGLPLPKRPALMRDRPAIGDLSRLLPPDLLRAASPTWRNPGFRQDRDHPVVAVTREDAQAFCAWLTKQERRTYRLPTEAEWEYACRAGKRTRYPAGDRDDALRGAANVADASFRDRVLRPGRFGAPWDDGFACTAPVGKLQANGWGLYDTHGNVWEWCADGQRAYGRGAEIDPEGPRAAPAVARGGAWDAEPHDCRASRRLALPPGRGEPTVGFRVARPVAEKP